MSFFNVQVGILGGKALNNLPKYHCVPESTCEVVDLLSAAFSFGVVGLHAGAVSASLRTLLARIEVLRRFLKETKEGENAPVP